MSTALPLPSSHPLEPAQDSLATFLELSPNPVLEFARDGRMTCANSAVHALVQAAGLEHVRALLPEQTEFIVQTCLRTGQARPPFETTVRQRTLAWQFYPIPQRGLVHCHIHDVTERTQLEAELRHAQKLESVGRLAAGIAHDFNNVLTVIQGHAGLMMAHPNLPAELGDSLRAVSRAAERAAKLTNQLLVFSRKRPWQPRPLDLNEVLTQLSAMLQRTLGEDITFQFRFAPDLPPLLGDTGLIEQVVMNLAVNARDAMSKGGQLVINTAVTEVDSSQLARHPQAQPGRHVCLTIMDTGCGMDAATLRRIFEPFFTTKASGKGTGLGLATVYGIVKQHRGWIEVQSEPGQGTTFKLFFPPARDGAGVAPEPPPAPAVPRGHETILVVEDEAPVRWTVRHVLERYGYCVLEASAGVEALAVWHRHWPEIALLLTDVVMPAGLTGQELAQKFCAQKPGLKVIYCSGYSPEAAGRGLGLASGTTFLQKPFDADKLARAVRAVLDTA